ncbi:AMP-binding protein, partial [Rhizobiaceae sp. 2RAB30]
MRKAFRTEAETQRDGSALLWEGWLDQQEPENVAPVQHPDSVIYTSGTTGRPKGVRRQPPTAEQAIAGERMRAAVFGIGEGDRVLVSAPLYHTAPNYFALRAIRIA